VVHDADAVAQPLGLLHVVRREHDRLPRRPQVRNHVPQAVACLRVEPRRRLVEEHDRRVVHEGESDREPLLLTAGEVLRPLVRLLPELRNLQEALRRQALLVHAREDVERLAHRQLFEHRGRLELHADDLPKLRALLPHVETRDPHQALVHAAQPFEDLPRRGLPRTVRPHEAEYLALLDGEGNVVHGLELPVVLGEALNGDDFGHARPRQAVGFKLRSRGRTRAVPPSRCPWPRGW